MTAHVPVPTVTMRQALSDDLLGSVMVGESWRPWKILLIALMGEALDDDERAIFRRFTGRDAEPGERCKEGWFIVGRRGGKSFATAVLIVYLATMIDYRSVLNVGERPRALCLAQNTDQAAIVFDYVCGIFAAVPILAKLVRSRLNEALELSNGLTVEVKPASARTLRGLTCVAIVADETAWWFTDTDSINSDVEILNAVRPSLITTRGLLAVISTVYARRGAVFGAWSKHYGPLGNPRILVARGSTQDFNSECPQEEIDDAMARDAVVARSEYFSEWRLDVEGFVTREAVECCVTLGCREIAPMPVEYVAFCDPAGGSGGGDAMTIAIAHREGDVAVLDAVRVRPPRFSPDDVVTEFVELLRRYKITEVVSDRWGSGFVAEAFEKRGITHRVSERVKSEIYREALALINSRKVELLDDERLINELCSLERKVSRGGRDSVDHPPGQHDDSANSCCGACVLAAGVGVDSFSVSEFIRAWLPGMPSLHEEAEERRRAAERAALIE